MFLLFIAPYTQSPALHFRNVVRLQHIFLYPSSIHYAYQILDALFLNCVSEMTSVACSFYVPVFLKMSSFLTCHTPLILSPRVLIYSSVVSAVDSRFK